jgi:hypothetical protein
LTGRGGSLGRYAGLSLDEIRAAFDGCKADRSMRGVSGVLRIAHEQLDSRGGLGSYKSLFIASVLLAVLSAGVAFVLPERLRLLLFMRVEPFLVCLSLFTGYLAWTTRTEQRQSLYQEAQIRMMAAEALEDLLTEPEFRLRPLDHLERLTLQRIYKKLRPIPESFVPLLGKQEGRTQLPDI